MTLISLVEFCLLSDDMVISDACLIVQLLVASEYSTLPLFVLQFCLTICCGAGLLAKIPAESNDANK